MPRSSKKFESVNKLVLSAQNRAPGLDQSWINYFITDQLQLQLHQKFFKLHYNYSYFMLKNSDYNYNYNYS